MDNRLKCRKITALIALIIIVQAEFETIAISEMAIISPSIKTPYVCKNIGDLSEITGLDLSNTPIHKVTINHYDGWQGISTEIILEISESNSYEDKSFYSNTIDYLPNDDFLLKIGLDKREIKLSGINYGSVIFGDDQQYLTTYIINWFEVKSPFSKDKTIVIYIDMQGEVRNEIDENIIHGGG